MKTIKYFDKVESVLTPVPHYSVTRTHSDGTVVTRKCVGSELKGQSPEDFLDRILSQHLSGTGAKREKSETSSFNEEK